MKRNRFFIILLLLFISIGFAYLSTNLDIFGNTLIRHNTWDIHFENNKKIAGNVDASTFLIDNDTVSVKFAVDLNLPSDYYEFKIDVVNDGTIDGMIKSINYPKLGEEESKYLDYSVSYFNNNPIKEHDLLKSNDRQTLRILVKYKDSVTMETLPNDNSSVSLEFGIVYEQSDDTANEPDPIGITSMNKDNLAVGDMVAIKSEEFFVIDTSDLDTTLISRYNLYVGDEFDLHHHKIRSIPGDVYGYCLQNSDALGYTATATSWIATVPFSASNYWFDIDNQSIKSKYLNNNIYDEDISLSSGDNYSISYYVKEYVKKLEKMGVNVVDKRLLNSSEASSLIDTGHKNIVYGLSYWLADAYDSTKINNVVFDRFYQDEYTFDTTFGVRPVIVLNTSDILK